jgi:phospholipid/cholesterol/gamma-HCH transport system ATP-binding protein
MTQASGPLVELRDVRKSFDQKEVLRGVSLALRKGTTLAVMGGSGAGKTVLFQGAALFDSLSVFENVAYPLREHTQMPLGEITDRVHRFLSLVGMPGTDELLPAELSGGMRKRVGIARALVMEPEVVFFDEPTAGLDPTNARLVAELMASLRSGVCDTAIVVTHDIEFANMIADQMAILHHGRFADMGTPAEIRVSANADVRRFLAGELRED